MLKKALALILALVLCLGVLAGCGPADTNDTTGGGNNDDGTTAGSDSVVTDYVAPDFDGWKLTMYAPNNKDFEAENCYVNQIVEKHLDMDWEVKELDSFAEQWNPMLAEQEIPSLTYRNSYTAENNQLGEDGAMINIYDHLDKMPNVKAYLENPAYADDVAKFTYKEGVMYSLPITQTGSAAVYGYIYREDIFAANNLTFPTTEDEFYNTLKKLKSIYPSSYPFVMRQMTGYMQGLEAYSMSWGKFHRLSGYNNTIMTLDSDGSYYYAPASDTYKEIVTYLHKLSNEGLLHPSSMTMDTNGWTEAFASDASFIGYDKMDRIPSLMTAGTKLNPDFQLVGAAPIAMGENGVAQGNRLSTTNYNWQIGDNEELDKTLAFVDWLYSEEGMTMTNWGIKDESYTVNADGTKALKQDFLTEWGSLNATGLSIPMMCAFKDFDAYLSSVDEKQAASIAVALDYAKTAPVQVTLTYNTDEQVIYDTYQESLQTYALGELSKFILGDRDISEWDTYIKELEGYHMADLLKIHESAYARLKG